METSHLAARTTPQTLAVLEFLERDSHSTNLQIVQGLRERFPDISRTTVHRITSRLLAQGKLRAAPATRDNSARFDSTLLPHDHFQCRSCDRLRDISVSRVLLQQVQSQLGACRIDGSIVISGICGRCSGRARTTPKA